LASPFRRGCDMSTDWVEGEEKSLGWQLLTLHRAAAVSPGSTAYRQESEDSWSSTSVSRNMSFTRE